jgi:hypothetical protein
MNPHHHPRTWEALTFMAGPWDNFGILVLAATERGHATQAPQALRIREPNDAKPARHAESGTDHRERVDPRPLRAAKTFPSVADHGL